MENGQFLVTAAVEYILSSLANTNGCPILDYLYLGTENTGWYSGSGVEVGKIGNKLLLRAFEGI
jgi:hypothetical protein